ncbi:MAG: hypothetical protein WAW86_00620 [Gammaproteobacteria bacterium]
MKRAYLILLLILVTSPISAWQVGSKNMMSSAAIHTTYFLTPNNQSITVRGTANVGYMNNGVCDYSQGATYPLGQEVLRTGDNMYIDGYRLLAAIGNAYSCIQITYMSDPAGKQVFQPVQEWFQLVWNGVNYVNSFPAVSQVTIP